jgi:hypothetical protein
MEQKLEVENLIQIINKCWKFETLSEILSEGNQDEDFIRFRLQVYNEAMSMINFYLDDKWDDEKTWKCYAYLKEELEKHLDESYDRNFVFFKIKMRWNESRTIDKLLNILMSCKITVKRNSIRELEIGDLVSNCYRTDVSKVIKKRKCKGNSWVAKIENVETKVISTLCGEYNIIETLHNNDFENPSDIILEFIS